MATLVSIKKVQDGAYKLSDEFYYNVDQIRTITFEKSEYWPDNELRDIFCVNDTNTLFRVDKDNLDIILNACNVVS